MNPDAMIWRKKNHCTEPHKDELSIISLMQNFIPLLFVFIFENFKEASKVSRGEIVGTKSYLR